MGRGLEEESDPDGAICSLGPQSCGACCWSGTLTREELSARLRRNLRLFARFLASRHPPGDVSLLAHELRALRVEELVLGLLQWLPLVGPRIRLRLQAGIVCPFAAFRDPAERQVGCLLHPRRWGGHDVRAHAAFRLLPGFGCGAYSYACSGATGFAVATREARSRFDTETACLDWYSYSAAAPCFPQEPAGPPAASPREGAPDARDRL